MTKDRSRYTDYGPDIVEFSNIMEYKSKWFVIRKAYTLSCGGDLICKECFRLILQYAKNKYQL